ncbi:MAG TPA: ABC transporter ATP-binding protein, partial [Desulfuromonadales bacterium]|nr:ABC transporter ATP-binding protein [Desulfuromonadales bacterium]
DALATRVVEVAGGGATSYIGNYEDFLRAKAGEGDASHSSLRVETAAAGQASASEDKEERKRAHEERREAQKAERRRQKELAELEDLIEGREADLAAIEAQMADPLLYQDAERWREISARHRALQDEIAGLYSCWEELQNAAAS